MTQEQLKRASVLQREIELLQNTNEELEAGISFLKTESVNYNKQNITIRSTGGYAIGTIDCRELINFLIQQRVKNETKIEEKEEEFKKI